MLSHVHFFCGLHILVNLAEVTSKTLKEFEVKSEVTKKGAAAESDFVFNQSESGFVRTACKAFTRNADEKSGGIQSIYRLLAVKMEEQQIG